MRISAHPPHEIGLAVMEFCARREADLYEQRIFVKDLFAEELIDVKQINHTVVINFEYYNDMVFTSFKDSTKQASSVDTQLSPIEDLLEY